MGIPMVHIMFSLIFVANCSVRLYQLAKGLKIIRTEADMKLVDSLKLRNRKKFK